MPDYQNKFIEGSTRKTIILDGKNISLFTVPRSPPIRMSFFRIMREMSGAQPKTIRRLALRYHFIALQHGTSSKKKLITDLGKLKALRGHIDTVYGPRPNRELSEVLKENSFE